MRSGIKQPITTAIIGASARKSGLSDPRTLIIAQTTIEDSHGKLFENPSIRELSTTLGDSSLAKYAYLQFRKYNPVGDCDVLCLKAPTTDAAPARNTLTITGRAAESKTITFYLCDDSFSESVSVVKGDPGEAVVRKLHTAMQTKQYPFLVGSSGDTLTIISATGTHNGYIITRSGDVSGLKIEESEGRGGAGAYAENVMEDMFKNALNHRYLSIVFDNLCSIEAVRNLLEARANVTNKVMSGVGFTVTTKGFDDAINEIKDYNSKYLTVFGDIEKGSLALKSVYNYIPIMFLSWFAAVRALRLTTGEDISPYVINTIDSTGGMSKATLPYHNTRTPYRASFGNREISVGDLQRLNDAGISMLNNNVGGYAELNAVVTTYTNNPQGQEDPTFKYLNTTDAALVAQEYIAKNLRAQGSQSRFTEGTIPAGSSTQNKDTILSAVLGYIQDLIDAEVVQRGADAYKVIVDNTEVVVNESKTGVIVYIHKLPVVNQFRSSQVYINISIDL